MASEIKALPGFFLNYITDLNQIKELCGDKNDNPVISEFLSHYRDLYDFMNDALVWSDDPDSGAPGSIVIDMYNCLLEDFRIILDEKQSDVSDKLRYVISGIRECMRCDFESEILVISDTDVSFAGEYFWYVQKNAAALVVSDKIRLKNAIQRLHAVSLYMTGNCPEYAQLIADATEIETLDASKNEYKDAADKLYKSAKAYIDSRKIVPNGETGRNRLSIAKELRDIGRRLARNLKLDMESDIKSEANKTVRERLEDKLQMAVDDLKQAFETSDGLALRNNISRIVYLDEIQKRSLDISDAKLRDLISNARVSTSIKQINKITNIVAAKFDSHGFRNAASDGTLRKFVIASFSKYAAAAAMELKASGA